MTSKLLLCIALFLPVAVAAAEKESNPTKASKKAEAAKRHPLKGVITGILAERSALLVKHEEIPGVMRAMTMMFNVDAATLKAAKEGQAITAMMSRQGDSWVLEDVKFVAPKKS